MGFSSPFSEAGRMEKLGRVAGAIFMIFAIAVAGSFFLLMGAVLLVR